MGTSFADLGQLSFQNFLLPIEEIFNDPHIELDSGGPWCVWNPFRGVQYILASFIPLTVGTVKV